VIELMEDLQESLYCLSYQFTVLVLLFQHGLRIVGWPFEAEIYFVITLHSFCSKCWHDWHENEPGPSC